MNLKPINRVAKEGSGRQALAIHTPRTQFDPIVMDPTVDLAAKPRSGEGTQSPAVNPPPLASHPSQPTSKSQPSSDPFPPVEKFVTVSSGWTREIPRSAASNGDGVAIPIESGQNPYINASRAVPINPSTMDTVRNVLSRWGKKVGETAKAAEDLSRNTWQHLKTGPSLVDAAMGRLAQGTKVIAEGGYEKIFRQTFDSFPEEQLRNTYACYLSTSAGPIMGVLYLSTAKLAFCSDNPLPYKSGDKTEWSYYKVVIPLHQLRAANPSISRTNPAEKYIQAVSVDNHEFWFMGFLNYDNAVQCVQEALHDAQRAQS